MRRGRPGERLLRGGPLRAGGQRPGGGLGPQAQAQLQRAWQLRSTDPAASAAELERMAGIAAQRGMGGMAAHLMIEAARSHHRAGQSAEMLAAVRACAGHAVSVRGQGKAARRISVLVAELQQAGDGAAAEAVEAEARSGLALGALPAAAAAPPMNRNQRRSLPTHCATCGGPVDYDVVFEADGTADCRYCGINLAG